MSRLAPTCATAWPDVEYDTPYPFWCDNEVIQMDRGPVYVWDDEWSRDPSCRDVDPELVARIFAPDADEDPPPRACSCGCQTMVDDVGVRCGMCREGCFG